MARSALRVRSGLSADDIEAFLDAFVASSELADVFFSWRPNLRDESDNLVVEAAVAGAAEVIVTHNERDMVGGELRFDAIRVMTPGALLAKERAPR